MLIEMLARELLSAFRNNSIQILDSLGIAVHHGMGEALG